MANRIAAGGRTRLQPTLRSERQARRHTPTECAFRGRGKLAFELYRAGEDYKLGTKLGRVAYTPGMQHDTRSISKSVTSLVFGIARDQKLIPGIDEPVFSLLPGYADLKNPEKDRIQLKHLLTMTSGLAWGELAPYSASNNSERLMNESPDPYRYVLEQRVWTPPGEKWEYSGGSTMLLADVIKKATNQTLADYAKKALFDPLGIVEFEWIGLKRTKEIAAHSGLRLRPRDMAKIGQLVLNKGEWNGQRIVSAEWIEASTEARYTGWFPHKYGYHWWVSESKIGDRTVKWIAAWGFGGQRIYIVPEYNLVVVITAGMYDADSQTIAVLDILDNFVLSTVKP